MTKIYVGNLPYSATEDELRELFSAHGEVSSVRLVNDRETGPPPGFGFVEIWGEDGEGAIQALCGSQMGGRTLKVNEARPRENSGGGGGGFRQRARCSVLRLQGSRAPVVDGPPSLRRPSNRRAFSFAAGKPRRRGALT